LSLSPVNNTSIDANGDALGIGLNGKKLLDVEIETAREFLMFLIIILLGLRA